MAYEKQSWDTGTVIEEGKLLHVEDGIYDVAETADKNSSDIKQNAKDIEQNASDIQQNAKDIATNKTNIETNATNISKNADDIAANKEDADGKYNELNSALAALGSAFQATLFEGSSTTVSASGTADLQISFTTPSGYTPLGVVGYYTGNSRILPYRVYLLTSNGYVQMTVRNVDSSDQSGTPAARVLFVKTSLL